MYFVALSLGVISYILFFIGVLSLLTKQVIYFIVVLYILVLISRVINRRKLALSNNKKFYTNIKRDKKSLLCIALLLLQIGINLIGALGPETAFDALWYHLTLPKIYLESEQITFIPGGLLYYSAMPKLIEMLYIIPLALEGETFAKIIHFIFGLLSCFVFYKITRQFLPRFHSLLAVVIFYSNLVVGWESTTAYIDLGRTFYELLAVHAYLQWYTKEKQSWLVLSAIMVGLAITTKLLALGTLVIFLVLMMYINWRKKTTVAITVNNLLLFTCIALVVPLPWFIFSYIHTGSFIYPFFTQIYPASLSLSLINPLLFIKDIISVLVFSPDPLSPLYLLFFPYTIYYFKKFPHTMKMLSVYSLLTICMWYITPRTGGGRFLLPFLPIYSLIIVFVINKISNKITVYRISLFCVLFVSIISILYRGVANTRYIPYLFANESKSDFLNRELNFRFGDFYDTDNYFARNIPKHEKVLLIGFHNLYYVNFSYTHESWAKKGDTFTYIATQQAKLPQQFENMQLIYENDTTFVKLYKSERGKVIY